MRLLEIIVQQSILYYMMYYWDLGTENNNTVYGNTIIKKLLEFRKSVARRRFTVLGI